MIAPMYTELPCRLRKCALFDVLDMGPIYSYWDVMLGLACHRTGMATNARLVVYYKSVVHHNSRDEQSMQKVLYQPIRIPRIAPPANQAPTIEPTFPPTVTIRTLPTRFLQNRETSSNFKKS